MAQSFAVMKLSRAVCRTNFITIIFAVINVFLHSSWSSFLVDTSILFDSTMNLLNINIMQFSNFHVICRWPPFLLAFLSPYSFFQPYKSLLYDPNQPFHSGCLLTTEKQKISSEIKVNKSYFIYVFLLIKCNIYAFICLDWILV